MLAVGGIFYESRTSGFASINRTNKMPGRHRRRGDLFGILCRSWRSATGRAPHSIARRGIPLIPRTLSLTSYTKILDIVFHSHPLINC